jgi:hypothetical protein
MTSASLPEGVKAAEHLCQRALGLCTNEGSSAEDGASCHGLGRPPVGGEGGRHRAFECLYRLMAAVMTEAMDGEFRLAASSSIADGFRWAHLGTFGFQIR